jgi:hypothetical protein
MQLFEGIVTSSDAEFSDVITFLNRLAALRANELASISASLLGNEGLRLASHDQIVLDAKRSKFKRGLSQ